MRGDFRSEAMQYRNLDIAAQRRAEEAIMSDLDREQTRLGVDLSDSRAVAKAIRAALSMRSSVRWSVTCGRGTAYGWMYIAPPASITDDEERTKLRVNLAMLLELGSVSCPETIPSARDYRAEYLARARGEKPVIIGEKYWD